ncbi:DUF1269 domain-containing protein [Thiohalorhabdus denitrificans]|uniref:DUF1269 domain-containing protein n=1 Tax=Thiohalorhabdus denitrificans TaxID=381306 RepID=A0A1G5GWU2_9GAMM|nr:DUF1269 domain-containing protein [Thiohalorhabdus denitrificans]SCY55837.1 hypothetical protein SAMN05661077_2483 [Thiohalorhabdus denitrificans]
MTMSHRRRRLYFILPDVQITRDVVNELLLARVDERHLHCLAREDLDLGDLPQADVFQRSDIIHGAGLGLALGGATGAIAGVATILFQPSGWAQSGGLVLAIALVGALVGMWASGMIGTSVPNSRLKAFQKDLDAGRVLLMVDIPEDRVEEIRELVKKHHPEASDRGTDPHIPAFP